MRDGLTQIIHGFNVAKAPRVRQIGTRMAESDKSELFEAGPLDRMSRNDERARPKMRRTWRLQQGTNEYSGSKEGASVWPPA